MAPLFLAGVVPAANLYRTGGEAVSSGSYPVGSYPVGSYHLSLNP